MFKIQILNAIAPTSLKQFPSESYEIGTEILNPDAMLVRSHPMHDMNISSSVKAIGRAGAGVNNIPVAMLTKRGIPVFNTPGANANAVCELVLAGMLLASRKICQAWQYVQQLQVEQNELLEKEIEANKKRFTGFELLGKTLGVIGLGSVGVKVANAAIHLGMRVVGYDPTITVNRAWELSASVQQARSLEDLLLHADFVTIHVPLTNETKNMFNHSRLKLMKPSAVLVNFSRDGIVDNDVLLQSLNEKKLYGYVNDFPSVSLKKHPLVISLPHLGASTKEAEENCALMMVKQIRDFFEIGTITNSVNFPTVELPPFTQGFRLAIVNANIPNMVAQISAKLAGHRLNIISLYNKSRDEIAYTVIDVAGQVEEVLLKEIASIQGVIQLRLI